MKHWAADLIGKPYQAGARGPDAFDCLGLVRHYFQARHGVDLPEYNLLTSTPEDLHRFTRATGWRRCAGSAQDEDLLMMEGFEGRHVGVVVATSEGLGLLHATGKGSVGHVVWQPLNTLIMYRHKEIWRKP